jgi:hypothetical protein
VCVCVCETERTREERQREKLRREHENAHTQPTVGAQAPETICAAELQLYVYENTHTNITCVVSSLGTFVRNCSMLSLVKRNDHTARCSETQVVTDNISPAHSLTMRVGGHTEGVLIQRR